MLLIPRSLLGCELSLLDKQHLAISYSLHFMLLNAVSAYLGNLVKILFKTTVQISRQTKKNCQSSVSSKL